MLLSLLIPYLARLGLILGLIQLTLTSVAAEEPWSISDEHPVTIEAFYPDKNLKHGHENATTGLSGLVFRFYQNYISAIDGATCYYRPTCSLYAAWAIEKYGSIKGSIMAADRLIRCHGGQSDNRYDPPFDYSQLNKP